MRTVTLVVPIDYGSALDPAILSRATVEAINTACACVKGKESSVAIACCAADFPKMGMYAGEAARRKRDLLREAGVSARVPVVIVPASNSILEARNIRNEIKESGLAPNSIVLVCDSWHALRLRMIWPLYFPGVAIEYKTARYVRGSDYTQILLRRPLTWIFANFAGLLAMKIFGVDTFVSIQQP